LIITDAWKNYEIWKKISLSKEQIKGPILRNASVIINTIGWHRYIIKMNCQNRKQWSIVSILNTTYVETSDQLIPTYIVIFGINELILPGSLLCKQQKFMINMCKVKQWILLFNYAWYMVHN